MPVPSLVKLTVAVLWQGSHIDVTLISPTDRTITCPTADPDVVCDERPTSTTITVHTPEVGDWTVRLFGAAVPPEGEQVSTVATGEPIPIPVAVGGIADLPALTAPSAGQWGAPDERSGRSAANYAVLTASAAAVAIAGGAWYTRRRWLR